MINIRVFLFACLTFLNFISNAQTFFPDSLLTVVKKSEGKAKADALNELSKELQFFDKDDIKKFATEALSISKKENYIKGEGEALINLGIYFSYIGQIDSASEIINKGIEKIAATGDSLAILFANGELGLFYAENNRLKESLIILQKTYNHSLIKSNLQLEATIHKSLGVLYNKMRDFNNAEIYLNKACAYYLQMGFTNKYIDCLLKKAELFNNKKKSVLSLKTTAYALSIAQKNNLSYAEWHCLKFLYNLNYSSGNYKNALECLISIGNTKETIRSFKNKRDEQSRAQELIGFKKNIVDSLKKTLKTQQLEFKQNQIAYHTAAKKEANIFLVVISVLFFFSLFLTALSIRFKNTIRKNESTIKNLQEDFNKINSKQSSNTTTVKERIHDNNVQLSTDRISQSASDDNFNIELPENFFRVGVSPHLWSKYNKVLNTFYLFYNSGITQDEFASISQELTIVTDNNSSDFSKITGNISTVLSNKEERQGALICIDLTTKNLSVFGKEYIFWAIKSAGKKGLKVNGKQILPKKAEAMGSLYEIQTTSESGFSAILEEGDIVYLTHRAGFESLTKNFTSNNIVYETFLLNNAKMQIKAQEEEFKKQTTSFHQNNFVLFGFVVK